MESTSGTARIFALLKEQALRLEQGLRGWSVVGFTILLLLAVSIWLFAGGRPGN